jgi:hypothetical protein
MARGFNKQWSLRLRADVHPPADAVAVELVNWTGEKDHVVSCLVAFRGSGSRHRLNSSQRSPVCGVDVGDRPEHLDCRCGRGVSTRVASRSRVSPASSGAGICLTAGSTDGPGCPGGSPTTSPTLPTGRRALCGMGPPPVVPSGSLPSCRSTKRGAFCMSVGGEWCEKSAASARYVLRTSYRCVPSFLCRTYMDAKSNKHNLLMQMDAAR